MIGGYASPGRRSRGGFLGLPERRSLSAHRRAQPEESPRGHDISSISPSAHPRADLVASRHSNV